jgi:hypothetical protein
MYNMVTKIITKNNPYTWALKKSQATTAQKRIFWLLFSTVAWIVPPAPYVYLVIVCVVNRKGV